MMNDLYNISLQEIINEAFLIQNSLHFLRASWFYAFIPLLLFLFLSHRATLNNKNWSGIIDRQLIPFVLSKTGHKHRRYPLILIFIAGSLCITALAGPVYKKLPQPVYREQSSLVVLFDLSQSMNATDIKPSRLSRAKLELLDLLKSRKTGQTALVVYAADAFVVTPLTDDNATIANMVPSLQTDMMPAQGSDLSKALSKALSLLTQAGIINGNILVITDDVHQRDETAIKKLVAQGHRLSIFGIGTTEGAPIPLAGSFLLNSEGAIVIPKLRPSILQKYALHGGGLYSSLQADDSDTRKFTSLFQSTDINKDVDTKNLQADTWQEEGHWLLLPLVFFAALWARKGWLGVQLLFVFSVTGPLPQPAYADSPGIQKNHLAAQFINTENLWHSPDQKAMEAFNRGENKKAAENFTQAEWKASALYRNGDYEAAARILDNINSDDAYYNKGNALARQGKLEEAIKAYEQALDRNKNNVDASYNRDQVKQALKKQQQNKQQQGEQPQDNQQDGEQQQNEQSQDSKQDNQQQDSQQQKDQQQNSDQSNEQQKNSQQSDKQSAPQSKNDSSNNNDKDQQQPSTDKTDDQDQQQMEQQQLKQRDAEAEAEQQKREQQQYQQEQKENTDATRQQEDIPQQDQQQKPDRASEEVEDGDSEEKPMEIEVNPVEASITEDEKATEQWLKRIPDDPGGLLRRKFYYQYKNIPNQSNDNEPW